MKQKLVYSIGWVASFLGGAMFLSYLDQIRLNLSDQPGSIVLPAVTVTNCIMWATYGLVKDEKDWPIIVCNMVGIITGDITALTAIVAKI